MAKKRDIKVKSAKRYTQGEIGRRFDLLRERMKQFKRNRVWNSELRVDYNRLFGKKPGRITSLEAMEQVGDEKVRLENELKELQRKFSSPDISEIRSKEIYKEYLKKHSRMLEFLEFAVKVENYSFPNPNMFSENKSLLIPTRALSRIMQQLEKKRDINVEPLPSGNSEEKHQLDAQIDALIASDEQIKKEKPIEGKTVGIFWSPELSDEYRKLIHLPPWDMTREEASTSVLFHYAAQGAISKNLINLIDARYRKRRLEKLLNELRKKR